MSNDNFFSIHAKIEFRFDSSQIRDSSFSSFLPEFKKLQTKRSQILMEKSNDNTIIFDIRSNDITAFRASINEIISFGRVITNTLKIVVKP